MKTFPDSPINPGFGRPPIKEIFPSGLEKTGSLGHMVKMEDFFESSTTFNLSAGKEIVA